MFFQINLKVIQLFICFCHKILLFVFHLSNNNFRQISILCFCKISGIIN